MLSATAQSALDDAINWLKKAVEQQAYGEVIMSVTLQANNIVLIKESIQETKKP